MTTVLKLESEFTIGEDGETSDDLMHYVTETCDGKQKWCWVFTDRVEALEFMDARKGRVTA